MHRVQPAQTWDAEGLDRLWIEDHLRSIQGQLEMLGEEFDRHGETRLSADAVGAVDLVASMRSELS